MKCHTCGTEGHVARDCQYENEFSPAARPSWCGECDPATRLVDHGNYAQRCYRCWAWPAKGTRPNQHLSQHRRCGGCGTLIYAFDAAPCGKHQPAGLDAHGHAVRDFIEGIQ